MSSRFLRSSGRACTEIDFVGAERYQQNAVRRPYGFEKVEEKER
jgi:hypothetical protein